MDEEENQLMKLYKTFIRKVIEPEEFDAPIHNIELEEVNDETIKKFRKRVKQQMLFETFNGDDMNDLDEIIIASNIFDENLEEKNRANYDKEQEKFFITNMYYLFDYLNESNNNFYLKNYKGKIELDLKEENIEGKFPIPNYISKRIISNAILEDSIKTIKKHTNSTITIQLVYETKKKQLEKEINYYIESIQSRKYEKEENKTIFENEIEPLLERYDEYQSLIRKINESPGEKNMHSKVMTTLNLLNSKDEYYNQLNQTIKAFITYSTLPN